VQQLAYSWRLSSAVAGGVELSVSQAGLTLGTESSEKHSMPGKAWSAHTNAHELRYH